MSFLNSTGRMGSRMKSLGGGLNRFRQEPDSGISRPRISLTRALTVVFCMGSMKRPIQIPAKKEYIGNPNPFLSLNPGLFQGKAVNAVTIEETRYPTNVSEATFEVDYFASIISNFQFRFFVNERPLGEEIYHLGQEIKLSYEISAADGSTNVPIGGHVWEINAPVPRIFSIPKPYNTGELLSVEPSDFFNSSITFCLYDFYQQNEENEYFAEKTGKLTLVINGKPYSEHFKIRYEKPYLSNFRINKPDQRIQVFQDSMDSEWKIGFRYKDKIGISASADVHNFTNEAYFVTFTQLIQRENSRHLFDNPEVPFEQFLKTIPVEAPFYTPPKFWLDTFPPGLDEDATEEIKPGGKLENFPVADDIPLYSLSVPPSKTPVDYAATSSFIVVFWAKPAYQNYDKGIWAPIKRMVWHWSGKTRYLPETSGWVDNDDNYFLSDLTVTPVEFPKWPDRAISGDQPGGPYPEWRDKK